MPALYLVAGFFVRGRMGGMPYASCPKCGAVFHLQVGNIEEWLAERHPDCKIGDVVPEICFNRWKLEQGCDDRDQNDSQVKNQ
jgi:hypothetical protein